MNMAEKRSSWDRIAPFGNHGSKRASLVEVNREVSSSLAVICGKICHLDDVVITHTTLPVSY